MSFWFTYFDICVFTEVFSRLGVVWSNYDMIFFLLKSFYFDFSKLAMAILIHKLGRMKSVHIRSRSNAFRLQSVKQLFPHFDLGLH